MKKILLSCMIVLSMLFVVPLVVPELQDTYTVQAASVKLNKTKLTLNVKETYTLKVKGTSKKVKWSTSNKKVAKVSSKGKVTAKKKGKVTITAKVNGKKFKCKIKVEKPTLNKTATKIALNQTDTLKVAGTSQKIKWSSENTSIATVNSKGKITPKKVGTTKIVAKIGKTKYKCKVTVVEPNYKSNIALSYTVVDDDVLITIKNNNTCQIDYVGININFYKNNVLVDHTFTNHVCIPKGGTAYDYVSIPEVKDASDNYVMIDYDSIELVVSSANVYNSSLAYKDMRNKLTINHSASNNKIVGTITNNSSETIDSIELFVLFYRSGTLVGWSTDYLFSLEDSSTDTFDISRYWNSSKAEYEDFDSYKLVINEAYNY